MGLFDIFSNSSVNVTSIVTIHIYGRPDEAATKRLVELVGDLAVIRSLKENLKLSHEAYQEFADTFADHVDMLRSRCQRQLESAQRSNASMQERRSQIAEVQTEWQRLVASHFYTKQHFGVRSCDSRPPDSFPVLRKLVAANVSDRRYQQGFAQLRANTKLFFADALAAHTALEAFDDTFRPDAIALLQPRAAKVTQHLRGAARACDQLLKDAEGLFHVATSQLQEIFPGSPFVLP